MNKKRIDLKKDVFNKSQYSKTISTSFEELGVKTISEQLNKEVSIEDFFNLYNQLFYEIPSEGDTNSHRYLVIQSGEYINFDENLEEIEALREEIARLRTDILDLRIQNIELETGQKLNINTDALKNQISNIGSNIESNQTSIAEAQAASEKAIAEANTPTESKTDTSGVGYF